MAMNLDQNSRQALMEAMQRRGMLGGGGQPGGGATPQAAAFQVASRQMGPSAGTGPMPMGSPGGGASQPGREALGQAQPNEAILIIKALIQRLKSLTEQEQPQAQMAAPL